jgi:AcrR family transcriptional regulator
VGRQREHSDEQLLNAIGVGLSAACGSWSLAEAAEAAGVHPATLIKRFGSRHGLLVALSRRWVDSLPRRPITDDPLDELTSWVDQTASPQTRADAAAAITMVVEDLKDDQLAQLLRQGWARQLRYLAALVADGRTLGRLTRAPEPPMAAALLVDVMNGSALRAAAGSTSRSSVNARASLHALLKGWK